MLDSGEPIKRPALETEGSEDAEWVAEEGEPLLDDEVIESVESDNIAKDARADQVSERVGKRPSFLERVQNWFRV